MFWPVSMPMTCTLAGPEAMVSVIVCPGFAPVAFATTGPSTTGAVAAPSSAAVNQRPALRW